MISASIVLLLKNAEKYLDELLQAIQNQEVGFEFEILAIDSGSKDRTLKILNSYPAVRVVHIAPESFNHGLTRNLGAMNAHPAAEYIVYLTQDATPFNEKWLVNLILPFLEDPQVAGVFSRHIPRPDASASLVRQLTTMWQTGGQQRLVKKMPASQEEFLRNRFYYNYYSNTSSALRREVWEKFPFPAVPFAEDAVWADEVIQAGYTIIFNPLSIVTHSHSYNFVEQFRQNVDYTNGIKELFHPKEYDDWRTWMRQFRGIPRNTWRDWIFIRTSPYFSGKPNIERLQSALFSPFWHLASSAGGWVGANVAKFPAVIRLRKKR
jgi:rhamnosyltransferase